MIKTRISKYISLLLRHRPEAAGLTLDPNGWCDTDALVNAVARRFSCFNIGMLEEIVATNDKQRYSYNKDKTKIRANQGHSVKVDVELPEATPPDILYHGTAEKFVESILQNGLLRRDRLYVHLSPDAETAETVALRHGVPHIFAVDCRKMAEDGYKFYLSKNNVWLTEHVPPAYLMNHDHDS